MLTNPLNDLYAPDYIDVLVTQQGKDLYGAIITAMQQGNNTAVYNNVIYDSNLQLLQTHGFRIVSVPQSMMIMSAAVKYTIKW